MALTERKQYISDTRDASNQNHTSAFRMCHSGQCNFLYLALIRGPYISAKFQINNLASNFIQMTNLLQYLKDFSPLSEKGGEAIVEISRLVEVNKNKDLQSIGHICKTIYFLNKGIARIYYFKDGIDVTESFAFENNIIARVESLFSGKPSRKAIQIIEDAQLVAIDANRLFELYDIFPEIERLFRKIFEAAYVNTVNRIEGMQFHTAEERYKSLINEAPDVLQRVPLKYVASYLGITQQSLSRIRSMK